MLIGEWSRAGRSAAAEGYRGEAMEASESALKSWDSVGVRQLGEGIFGAPRLTIVVKLTRASQPPASASLTLCAVSIL